MAGIACVRPGRPGRLQKMGQILADHRRERQENRLSQRDGDGIRRSLRLLFVMHLHDRHGAHNTLHGAVKQAGQRTGRRKEGVDA
ncbi:hypothetical protein BOO88_09035 [Stutzerimonas stutzeri]|nr:hypothetical protein BOO88_09035 [Stutzerimonas stutzeri]